MSWMKFELQWKSWQRRIRPNNWKAKRMIYMKISARRSLRERKAGVRKVNWIWTISARWRNEASLRGEIGRASCRERGKIGARGGEAANIEYSKGCAGGYDD